MPTSSDVSRHDVAGAFRLFIGPKDEVTNVPVVSLAFDVPELLQYIPGTPAVVRIAFQITCTRGKLQPQTSGEENTYIYVDLSKILDVVENLAEYAAIRSDLIHRGVLLFRGVTKKFNIKPVLNIQLYTYFVERSTPLSAYMTATVDYFFNSVSAIMPVSTPTEDNEESSQIPFAQREGYLKFLLLSAQSQLVDNLGLREEMKEFVFC